MKRFQPRPYDPNRKDKRTPAQKAASNRNFRIFQLRGEIAAFDAQLASWLATARGRFAAWIAERDRLAGEPSS